jgi:hypothetical protein
MLFGDGTNQPGREANPLNKMDSAQGAQVEVWGEDVVWGGCPCQHLID